MVTLDSLATTLETSVKRIERRLDQSEQRFDKLEAKIDTVDEKVGWRQNHEFEQVRMQHKNAAELYHCVSFCSDSMNIRTSPAQQTCFPLHQ
ncbi:MAG: hypothetical protein OXP71_04710 [Candidatus Poribacteria bacterium]|nr:hypothetical protein [Candidatus Poribacteria bacterium]